MTTSSSRLSGIRPLVIDEDERPRIEDFGYGETIFTRQFAFLPRWLRRR
jgi:hypothetical protein